MIWVLDASVIAKWYIPEVFSREAENLREWILSRDDSIAAPQMLLVETTNLLWKKTVLLKEISQRIAFSILRSIPDIGIQWANDALLLEHALRISIKHHTAIYDMIYLALAQQLHSSWITADRKIVRRIEKSELEKQVIFLGDWEEQLKSV